MAAFSLLLAFSFLTVPRSVSQAVSGGIHLLHPDPVDGSSSVGASPVPHLLGPLASWLALPTRDTLHSSPTLMPKSLPGDPGGDLSPVLG